MKNYKQLIKELPSKKVVFAFGRFQPPTTGHELLVKAVKKLAGTTADHVIYASKTEDKKSNPLPVERKVYYLKRMFPKTNFMAANQEVRTFIEAAKELNKKYKNIVMVAGSDRVAEYTRILNTYNGKDFHFDSVEVVSAGERDPDSDSASGMSGTKMREAAKAGNFDLFKKGVPHTLTDLDARRLMNDIRKGMGLEVIKESFKVESNATRELYLANEIFLIGEKVQDADGTYEIMDRGTNYVTVADSTGTLSKKWLNHITTVESIVEDINAEPAPAEISFKGYTTKNFHHAPQTAKAFQQTIDRAADADPVAVLNAIKATDTYMKLNDMHREQGKQPDASEVKTWIAAHEKAKESLDRVGEFLHHEDYWHMHQHELEQLMSNFKETGKEEFSEELTDKTLKVSDKIKVARIIADAFGVENAEAGGSPETLVNAGLRKVKSKPFTADSLKIISNMLHLAAEVGIKYDNNLVPTKLKEGTIQPNGTDKIEVMTDRTKTVYYKDFKNILKQESTKDTESDHDAEGEGADTHTHVGQSMTSVADNSTLRRQKVKYHLGESFEAAQKHKEKALEAQKKGDSEAYHHHMSNHHEEIGKWHEDKGRHAVADISFKKAEDHHEASISGGKIKEESVQEEPAQKHRVQVTITDPNHTAVSKRKEKMQKFVKVAADSEESAVTKAKAHYTKNGYKVHEAEHAGMVKEDLDEGATGTKPGWMLKQDPALAKKIKDQQARKKFVAGEPSKKEVKEDLDEASAAAKLQKAFNSEMDKIKKERELGQKVLAAPKKEELDPQKCTEETEDDGEGSDLSDKEIDDMINNTHDDEYMEVYDDDEFQMVDVDTGEKIEDEEGVNEETLNEVLSRAERMRAKVRFAKTKAKRERRVMIALHRRSDSKTLNKRARRMAVNMMKTRIAKKPLNTLSVGEKERIERIIQRRKEVINRIAMKMTPRIRKIEQDRLSHKTATK